MSRTLGRLLVVSFVLLTPALAAAQSAITGVVRDTSGAVLPGVTVEAASDVLIEKVRTVVTDGDGAYRIIDLRPGTYIVTFTLPGLPDASDASALELPAEFTATINAELRGRRARGDDHGDRRIARSSTRPPRSTRRCSIARRSTRFRPAARFRASAS